MLTLPLEYVPPIKRVTEMLMSQYYDSVNFKSYLSVLAEEVQEVSQASIDTVEYRYLSKAFGKNLENIGEIVGAVRTIAGAGSLGLYGYYEQADSLGVNDKTIPSSLGGVLYSSGSTTVADLVLTDRQLRNYIRARIIQNHRMPTIDNILEYLELLLGKPDIILHVQEGYVAGEAPVDETAYYNVHYDEAFNPQEKALLAALISEFKPLGVRLTLSDTGGNIVLPDVSQVEVLHTRRLQNG